MSNLVTGSAVDTEIAEWSRKSSAPIAIIVPAYNEEASIAITLTSLLEQTTPPEKIIVVDDFSSDRTGEIARSFPGVTVIRPPKNTGSKAGAQNFALPFVKTTYVSAVDADTTLDNDAIEKMIQFLQSDPKVVAACTFVLPKKVKTLWERGRFIEYLFAFEFFKRVQDWYGKPLICSGCFSVYKTNEIMSAGGWSTRTLAEDMDLTWSFYEKGKAVRFNNDVFCYPIEPETFNIMAKQLKRWSHGWFQNFKLHWKGVRRIPVLREFILMGLLDALLGSMLFLVVAPLLAIVFQNPVLYAYAVGADVAFIVIPVAWRGYRMGMLKKVLGSIPSFLVLRLVNSFFFMRACISEMILKKSFTTYEKGH
jgi:biofilm PGA synthesis N-glycosyltransferase PgaC